MMKRLFFLLPLMGLLGCPVQPAFEQPKVKNTSGFPDRAINIVEQGCQWYTFDLDGKHYLYHRYGEAETLTQIMNDN